MQIKILRILVYPISVNANLFKTIFSLEEIVAIDK